MRNWIQKTLLFVLLPTVMLTAREPQEESYRLLPGTRRATEEEQAQLLQAYRAEMESDEAKEVTEKSLNLEKSYTYYNDCTLYGISQMGYKASTIMLTDGTCWTISRYDSYVAADWQAYNTTGGMAADLVYITTNVGWIYNNDYPFKLVNVATAEAVQAELSQAPDPTQACWINFIDYERRVVEVADTNGYVTVWKLSWWDQSIMARWQIGDRILFGRNNRWNGSSNPFLLINIETYDYARGDSVY